MKRSVTTPKYVTFVSHIHVECGARNNTHHLPSYLHTFIPPSFPPSPPSLLRLHSPLFPCLPPSLPPFYHRYKWGSVSHQSIGVVRSINRNGTDVCVDFPEQNNWTGLISEMEIVPGIHPRHRLASLGLASFPSSHAVQMHSTNFLLLKILVYTYRDIAM